jgi:hypothetical protein
LLCGEDMLPYADLVQWVPKQLFSARGQDKPSANHVPIRRLGQWLP